MTTKVPIKATKVIKTTDKTAQLESFVSTLGITTKAELYLCNSNAYINIDILLPILSVDLQWFIKNSEMPIHYIKLSKGVFINKYGMTKLLGQSKESISFKLQDYLYDIFYQVETKGSVKKSEISSRDELVKAAQLVTKVTHLSNELKMYQNVDLANKQLISDISSSYEALKNDYAVLNIENQSLKKKYSDLEDEYEQLQSDYNTIKHLANKLAKYVRVKRTDVIEAYDDNLEVEDTEEDEAKLHKDASNAKTALKKPKTKNPRTKKVQTKAADKKTYTLLRSSDPIDNDELYKWEISDKECNEDFKNSSTEYVSSGEYVTKNMYGDEVIISPPDMLWYCDLSMSAEKIKAINLFLQLSDFGTTEQTISQILDNKF
jgi:hypothetical protein